MGRRPRMREREGGEEVEAARGGKGVARGEEGLEEERGGT